MQYNPRLTCKWVVLSCITLNIAAACSESTTEPDAQDALEVQDAQSDVDAQEDTGCPAGMVDCGGGCTNVSKDHDNCGSCGNACLFDQVCFDGECVLECPPGMQPCAGTCVDVTSDTENCGSCGYTCPPQANADALCEDGDCTYQCRPGWWNLDGEEGCEYECEFVSSEEACNGVDDNCDNRVDEGFECLRADETECITPDGTCTGIKTCLDNCTWSGCEDRCTGGLTCCLDGCFDLFTDSSNCGECGNRCLIHERCDGSGNCDAPTVEVWAHYTMEAEESISCDDFCEDDGYLGCVEKEICCRAGGSPLCYERTCTDTMLGRDVCYNETSDYYVNRISCLCIDYLYD